MEKSENAVRSRLLEAGKEEFRDRGFLKASLRAICKKADVTTGNRGRDGRGSEADHGRLYGSGKTTASGRI